MKQKGNFVLRKLLDEYVLVPCKETAEQMNQVITTVVNLRILEKF